MMNSQEEPVSDISSDNTRIDGSISVHNQDQSAGDVDVNRGRADYEELRREVTKHTIRSNHAGHDEEQGFDLERFLRGSSCVSRS